MLCGLSGQVPGFSLPDSQGVMKGLDADSCRAVTAAALGDAAKVKFVATTTQKPLHRAAVRRSRHAVPQHDLDPGPRGERSGWNSPGVNYYDGTGFLVKKSAGVKTAKEMDGATICVQPGTSTELAINDYYRLNNMKFTPILIQDLSEIQGAFLSGRCDAYSTDASALATFRFSQGPKADDLVLLPDIISKEPTGRDGP